MDGFSSAALAATAAALAVAPSAVAYPTALAASGAVEETALRPSPNIFPSIGNAAPRTPPHCAPLAESPPGLDASKVPPSKAPLAPPAITLPANGAVLAAPGRIDPTPAVAIAAGI